MRERQTTNGCRKLGRSCLLPCPKNACGQPVIDSSACADPATQVTLHLQLFKRSHDCSSRDVVMARKVPRRRKTRPRKQAVVENGAAHLFVEPTRQGGMPRAFAKREFQGAVVFGH